MKSFTDAQWNWLLALADGRDPWFPYWEKSAYRKASSIVNSLFNLGLIDRGGQLTLAGRSTVQQLRVNHEGAKSAKMEGCKL